MGKIRSLSPSTGSLHDQCDQIWRNFPTLAKKFTFLGLFRIWNFLVNFYALGKILLLWGIFLKNNQAIWSSWPCCVIKTLTLQGETREQRIVQYHEEPGNPPVLALREGSILEVRLESAKLIGPFKARLFVPGKEAQEFDSGTDFGFLLKWKSVFVFLHMILRWRNFVLM